MSEICFICLKQAEILFVVNNTDSLTYKILLKLKNCVPEVEWNNNFKICKNCVDDLNKVYAFKKLCIQSFQSYLLKSDTVQCENAITLNTGKLESTEENIHSDDDKFNTAYSDNEDIKENITIKSNIRPILICFHCNGRFKLKSVLINHIRKKHSNKKSVRRKKQFCCIKCGKMYTTEYAMKKHFNMCKSKENENFAANDENQELNSNTKSDNNTSINNLKIKINSDDEEIEIKVSPTCNICGTTFSNKYLIKRHLRNVHATEKIYKCDMCDRSFASPLYLNAHKRYHSGERSHICSFCGKGFITTSDLYHHEQIHANKRAYRCEICPKAFNTSSDLHKHKICVHVDRSKWKYECSFCQRRFPLKTNLDTHTKTHTGEKNFACHLCDRRCINRSVLMRHIETHSNVISFKCHLCMQGYKYQKSLDVHMAKIHGLGNAKVPEKVKKYFCHVCPKSYFANNKLQKHIRSHTGERPFQCPACDKPFIDKSYVKQHLKTAHGAVDRKNL